MTGPMHNTERPLGTDDVPMARIPAPAVLWRSFRFWTWILFALAALAALPDILVQYWFNQTVLVLQKETVGHQEKYKLFLLSMPNY